MERKGTFSKILVIVGTVLVWFPILAPFLFGIIPLVSDGVYRFDFLMPAELGILVFIGGIMLMWGAIRVRSRKPIVAWGLVIAAASIAVLFALGDVTPGSPQFFIAIGLLIAYALSIVVMGIGGALLWSDLFKKLSP
jgi:hypothetical protein